MRRIPIRIRIKKKPDQDFGGHLVINELRSTGLTFFSSRKLGPDEQIEISGDVGGSPQTYSAQLLSCHEPMSSGKILASVPVEGQPLPNRIFFRCIAKFNAVPAATVTPANDETAIDVSNPAAEAPIAA